MFLLLNGVLYVLNISLGKYIFVQASKQHTRGDKARLISEFMERHYTTVKPYCLRFWYHMKGADIGTLNLYIKTGAGSTNEQIVWSLSGNQGNSWKFGTAPMYSKIDYQV